MAAGGELCFAVYGTNHLNGTAQVYRGRDIAGSEALTCIVLLGLVGPPSLAFICVAH